MKTILLFTAALLFSLSDGFAQYDLNSDFNTRINFGAKIGTNYSNVWDSEGEAFNADAKFGLAFGAFLSIPIGTDIGIQPEVLFSQRGFQAIGKILGRDYDFKRTTSYLDIPLYFAVKPADFITILVGPQFSYLLKREDQFANAVTTISQEEEFENDNIRENTLGAAVGIDLNFGHFLVGLRANWDLQENNGEGESTTPRYKNQWFQGTLGYRF